MKWKLTNLILQRKQWLRRPVLTTLTLRTTVLKNKLFKQSKAALVRLVKTNSCINRTSAPSMKNYIYIYSLIINFFMATHSLRQTLAIKCQWKTTSKWSLFVGCTVGCLYRHIIADACLFCWITCTCIHHLIVILISCVKIISRSCARLRETVCSVGKSKISLWKKMIVLRAFSCDSNWNWKRVVWISHAMSFSSLSQGFFGTLR